MNSRRNFFKLAFGGFAALILTVCKPQRKNIKVSFKPSPASRGHATWKGGNHFKTGQDVEKEVVIIGGGISGLSAAWHLKKKGFTNILILELDEQAGGNSVSGSNSHSRYPYGAHYLTLPNPENTPLVSFLHEKGIIIRFDEKGKPVFNETDLCFDPEERLYIRGTFQEGLLPSYGIDAISKKQISDFFKQMEVFRQKKGFDQKYFFNIPRAMCSEDAAMDYLDGLTFSEFLARNGFTSDSLLWYLDYCCRDDFGGGLRQVSAWAGINYFAAHRANPANTDPSRILTWPEGNARLVNLLEHDLKDVLSTGKLVKHIHLTEDKVKLECLDFKQQTAFEVTSKYCIAAIPPFVLAHVIDKSLSYPFEKARALKHIPWLVAAVTLSHLPEGRGVDLCWDNVGYKTRSLGYIYNQHQTLGRANEKQVISLYMPLDDCDPRSARIAAEGRTAEQWQSIIISELEVMHPSIGEIIEEIEICIWGHGMILPEKGLSRGDTLKQLSTPIENRLFFAHSDLAAYSTFEEAFDQGYRAADMINNNTV